MNQSKQLALSTYYFATLPLRAVRNRRLAVRGRAPICVGTFHRIADDAANNWTTSRNEFRRAIQWLTERFDIVTLAEAQRRIDSPMNDRPTFALTFDDGYAENCDWALPWLLDCGVPFTYFVTAEPVLTGTAFPHDSVRGNRFAANTIRQLRELAGEELVEIGAHTRTHADLGAIHDLDRLFDEVICSSDELSQAIGCRIERFAFPFGQHVNLHPAAFEMLAEQGFAAACSAYGGYNFAGDDSFHVQRMCCDGPAIKTMNWASLDPYKQWRVGRFDYQGQPRGANAFGPQLAEAAAQ